MATDISEAYAEAIARLRHHLGAEPADAIIEQSLRLARMTAPSCPNELMRFACMLVEAHAGPIAEGIGRALKVRALLLGAKAVP